MKILSVVSLVVALIATEGIAASIISRADSKASSKSQGVVPLGSSSDVFNEGGPCRASWTPDTSGSSTWKNMKIELMTGSNLKMVTLATVAENVDGTSTSTSSYNYTCPEVQPNSAIYFLQYTHGDEEDPTWTTRFAIADADGKTTTPPNSNQPKGGSPAIPWGEGKLVTEADESSNSASSSASTASSSASTSNTVSSSGSDRNKTQSSDSSPGNTYSSSQNLQTSDAPRLFNRLSLKMVVVALSVLASIYSL